MTVFACLRVVLSIVAAILAAAWYRAYARRTLPFELWRSRLLYSERLLRCDDEWVSSARVDRAYLRPDGRVVLLELKTRRLARVYTSDVVELSAQKLVMERALRRRVTEHAYVLIQQPDGRNLARFKVWLLSSSEVHALARRRAALVDGRASPSPCVSPRLCHHCAFKPVCPSAFE